jgi:hypothetical protein
VHRIAVRYELRVAGGVLPDSVKESLVMKKTLAIAILFTIAVAANAQAVTNKLTAVWTVPPVVTDFYFYKVYTSTNTVANTPTNGWTFLKNVTNTSSSVTTTISNVGPQILSAAVSTSDGVMESVRISANGLFGPRNVTITEQ